MHPNETSHRVFLLRHLAQARGAFFRRVAEGLESSPRLCLFSSLSIRSKPGGHTRVLSQRHVLPIQDEALSKDLNTNNAEKLGVVSLPNDGRGGAQPWVGLTRRDRGSSSPQSPARSSSWLIIKCGVHPSDTPHSIQVTTGNRSLHRS
jgi:hypothetical protein